MFEPIECSHDELMDWLKSTIKSVNLNDITNAFLASLSTRRLELRSALGSYAVALHFPYHRINEKICHICGDIYIKNRLIDLNVLNFERYKWGGVRHTHMEYMAFDFEQFAKEEKIVPTEEDIHIMVSILYEVSKCEPNDRPRDLEKRLASVFSSNKAEREVLIEILSYCGILQPKAQLSYFDSFVNYDKRTIPPVNKIDWSYPICWWRGSDGINQEALKYYFPKF